jgi:uncharacterized protein (TIGR00299 family) protein
LALLYFDCFSGASGDMVLGALIDLGLPLEDLQRALGRLAVAPDTVWTERVLRAGISATKFHVRGETLPDHAHPHESPSHRREPESHRPESKSHRPLSEIYTLIDCSGLSAAGKSRVKDLFGRLGEAEAAIHGTSLDRVHLHEVGALDSIIDIVGTVFALEEMRIDRIVASPLNVGSGTIQTSHGQYPVPAPAALRLLRGVPVYAGAQRAELVTPTGALLVTGYAAAYGPMPPMRVERVGYGAGARDFPQTPNVLRAILGEADEESLREAVVTIEAEIDDMNPQLFGVVMDRLLAEGALDVFYTPIQMKKNRPGTLLTVVARPEGKDRLTSTIFRETTTIGVRYREMARECLARETVTVATELGAVRIKVARRGGEVLNAAPEFDDCVRLAAEHRVATKHVQALATKAFLDTAKRGL